MSVTRFVCLQRIIVGAVERVLAVPVFQATQWAKLNVDERVLAPNGDARVRDRNAVLWEVARRAR